MRVVLDTNVFISAVLGGRLGIIMDKWKAGKFILVISGVIASEYLEVINRPKFKISEREISAVTDYLLKTAEFVTPFDTITAVKTDPSDDKFLEAALEGNADCIVSGDEHLLALKTFRGIPVLTARKFIERLKITK
ncbi:MAG: putative toxin-antitoxin system toxin component, PIN family [bacterium]